MVHFVPSMLSALLEGEVWERCNGLKRVICSGEALTLDLQRKFHQQIKTAELHNLYGPTEASIDVSCWECRREWDKEFVPIGRAIANTHLYVLDKGMEPVGVGITGELYIGGIGLARGYLNRPELTAEKFVPDALSGQEGERLYSTGDLARWTEDGNLVFRGRLDHQVKVRGIRVELGEIEAMLKQHDGIQDAAVVVQSEKESKRLMAYIVLREGKRDLDFGSLRTYLKKKLPEYMVPAVWISLEELPLTHSGKLDRKTLETRSAGFQWARPDFAPPLPGIEEMIAQIYRKLLNVDIVGRHENFFDAGGHSLLLLQALRQAREVFNLDLKVVHLFEYPTIASLAAFIQNRMASLESCSNSSVASAEKAQEGQMRLHDQRARRQAATSSQCGQPGVH